MDDFMRGIRNGLIDFLKGVSGEDYDAVYYYIGGYDFDPSDSVTVEIVADLVLEKATADKINPYRGVRPSNLTGILYKDWDSVPPNMMPNVLRRKRIELESKQGRGMTYIPESSKFGHYIYSASSKVTRAQLNEIAKQAARSQTFHGQFTDNLKKQIENPVEEIGMVQLIASIIVVFLVVAKLLC